jgi:hypothetical protein
MADKNTLAQMLEHLVNEEQQKAEELFHEYVVTKSREIYEGLIESEIAEEEDKDEDEDEEMDEAAKDEDAEEDKVDENFEDIAIEGDDEEGDEMGALGGDATDDLEAELDAEEGDEEGEKDPEELFQDLDAIVDELQAKFDELSGGGDEGGDEMGDMGDEMKDDFDLETVREYVEKVAPAKMGDNGANTKSIVAGKNDMGGTAANILRADTANDGEVGKAGGQLKGSSLFKGKPTEDNAGNINVPGGKAGNAFSKKEPGHGAEKKGTGENAENKQSLFRGRR